MADRDPTRRTTRVPRLLQRVIRQRRSDAADREAVEGRAEPAEGAPGESLEQQVAHLAERVALLESQLESLQDSVHREGVRRERELRGLRRKIDPGEMARSLYRHARERGL